MSYEQKICCHLGGSFNGFSVFLNFNSGPGSRKSDEAQAFDDMAAATPLFANVW
jgi:hypothetical protein